MTKPIDYADCPSSVAASVFGISKNTLDKWRAAGAPFSKKGNRSYFSIPDLIDWKIRRELKKQGVQKTTIIEADESRDIPGVESTVTTALYDTLENGSHVARVQAAKFLHNLRKASGENADKTDDEISVTFIEIDSLEDGAIAPTGKVEKICPKCGELVELNP